MDAFKPEIISETILRRLLKQDIIYHIKIKNKERAETIIYTQVINGLYITGIQRGRIGTLASSLVFGQNGNSIVYEQVSTFYTSRYVLYLSDTQ